MEAGMNNARLNGLASVTDVPSVLSRSSQKIGRHQQSAEVSTRAFFVWIVSTAYAKSRRMAPTRNPS